MPEWHYQYFQPAATIQYIGHSEVEGIYWVPGFLHECHDAFHTDLTKKIFILGCFTKGKSVTFQQSLVLWVFLALQPPTP